MSQRESLPHPLSKLEGLGGEPGWTSALPPPHPRSLPPLWLINLGSCREDWRKRPPFARVGRGWAGRWVVPGGAGVGDENQHLLWGMLPAPGWKKWLTEGKNTLCQDLITSFICNHILINAIYTYHSPLLRNVSAPSHCAAWWRGLIIGRKMSPFSSSRMRAFLVPLNQVYMSFVRVKEVDSWHWRVTFTPGQTEVKARFHTRSDSAECSCGWRRAAKPLTLRLHPLIILSEEGGPVCGCRRALGSQTECAATGGRCRDPCLSFETDSEKEITF